MGVRPLFLAAAVLSASGPVTAYPVIREFNPFPGSKFLVPNNEEPHTSVVMLHGSEGGSMAFLDAEASILAGQGFAVLVLCYFDCNRGLTGPRQTLKDVDTGMVLRAVSWLRSQPRSNGRVAVYGFSRGAELALVIGSLTVGESERPTALIAHSPSDVFNSYFNWSWREASCWLCRRGQGQCNERSPRSDFTWNSSCGPDDETRMDFSQSAWLVGGERIRTGTRIGIEKFDGPVLITVGENDETWPVAQTRRIEATLRGAGREPEVHYYPGEGHLFSRPGENARRKLALEFLMRLP